eukprot:gene5601-2459_t
MSTRENSPITVEQWCIALSTVDMLANGRNKEFTVYCAADLYHQKVNLALSFTHKPDLPALLAEVEHVFQDEIRCMYKPTPDASKQNFV